LYRYTAANHPEYLTLATNPYNEHMSFIHHRKPKELVDMWMTYKWGNEDKLGDDDTDGAAHLNRCWNHMASELVPDHEDKPMMSVSLYCCNYFAASRDQIRRLSLATWQKLYDQFVVAGECVPGDGKPRDELRDKFDLGISLEHVAHVMFGGKDLDAGDDARCCGDECVLKDAGCGTARAEGGDAADADAANAVASIGGAKARAAQLSRHVDRMSQKMARYNGEDFSNLGELVEDDVDDAVVVETATEATLGADKTRIKTLEVGLYKLNPVDP
jgi:hypothetical protein